MKLSKIKPELEFAKDENKKLKAQIDRERRRAKQAQVSVDNIEIPTQTQKVALLTKERIDLQQTYNTLKQAEMQNASEQLSDALKLLSELEDKLGQERQEVTSPDTVEARQVLVW